MEIRRLQAIIIKETRELLRDPIYLGLALVVPIFILFLFGYGLSLDVDNLPVVVVDHDRSPDSREYIHSLTNSKYFYLVGMVERREEADELIKRGKARVILDIPPDFSRKIGSYEPVAINVTIDGSFPSRAQVVQGYFLAVNELFNQRLREDSPLGNIDMPIQILTSFWFNPSLESQNGVVPGMIVLNLMMYPALLGALLIVREKESGTIFNYFASPVSRLEIILGKAIPYIGVAYLEYIILMAFALSWFQVRFVGSLFVVSTATLLYNICTIGVGLLISVVTRSQLAAMLVTFLATLTPSFNFSGFTAPVSSQDAVGQFVARVLPATYFMEVLRGSFLKGLGFDFYMPQIRALTIYTIIVYALAWLLLKKRIA